MVITYSYRCIMEDDLTLLGVIPSDRKKLENMGITTLEQIAIMSVSFVF